MVLDSEKPLAALSSWPKAPSAVISVNDHHNATIAHQRILPSITNHKLLAARHSPGLNDDNLLAPVSRRNYRETDESHLNSSKKELKLIPKMALRGTRNLLA